MADLFVQVSSSQYPIYDIRPLIHFRSATFSGYKKTNVRIEWVDAMLQGKVENACHWCAEMICAGQFVDMWDLLFWFVGKYLSVKQTLVIVYMERRLSIFRAIVQGSPALYESMLGLRNCITIRKLFAELVCVVALAEKRSGTEEWKLDADSLLDVTNKLKADRPDYAVDIMRQDDPKELVIALNEMMFHLTQTRNAASACFWVEWMMGYLEQCKKRGEPLFCMSRIEYDDIDKKWRKDPVWLIWEALQEVTKRVDDGVAASRIMHSLFVLFRVKYIGLTTFKKRKSLIYYAVLLLTDNNVCWKHELLTPQNKQICQVATDNVHRIYKALQENAITNKDTATPSSMRKMERRENIQDSLRKWELLTGIDPTQQT